MQPLRNKVALVTGGASGLGLACARRFAQEGANVVIGDIAPPPAGIDARYARLDVTSEASWLAALDDIVNSLGHIDVLLNGAGIALDGDDVLGCTQETWRRTIAVNLDGTFLGCKLVSEIMAANGGGSIINIASINGVVGDGGIVAEGVAAYSASKGAVRLLTRSAALDLAARATNVRCNAILPGYFATPMVLDYLEAHPDAARARSRIEAAHPLGRMGRPDELTGMVMYLASERSAAVTGAEFVVDGGYMAR